MVDNQILSLKVRDLNIFNVLSSIAILNELGIDISSITDKFNYLQPSEGRGKKHSISRYKKKFNFIDESYNANPLSVKNAIKKLSMIKKINQKNS